MSEAAETLELRKQVLLARSSLCRLRIAVEITSVRESLHWPRVGIARVLRGAAIAIAFAKLAKSAAAYLRERRRP